MKLIIPSPRSALAVLAAITVTVVLALVAKFSVLTSYNRVLTPQIIKLIGVLDVFAALLGGYIAAQIAFRSPIKHAMVVAGFLASTVTVLSALSAEPPFHFLITDLGLVMCILLGAMARDWQRQRSWPRERTLSC